MFCLKGIVFMKKLLIILISLILLFSFASCGIKNQEASNNTSNIQTTTPSGNPSASAEINTAAPSVLPTVTLPQITLSPALPTASTPSPAPTQRITPIPSPTPKPTASPAPTPYNGPKIVDISVYNSHSALFLDSNGNVYFLGTELLAPYNVIENPQKIYSNAKQIFIGSDDEYLSEIIGIVDKNNNYYVKGKKAPDRNGYASFTKIASNVKKAGLGLILKQNNDLYIWGNYTDFYNTSLPELQLNANTPQLFLEDVKEFIGNYTHGYAITNNGDLYGWGIMVHGIDNFGFIPVKIASNVREVSRFEYLEWFITNNGELYLIPAGNNIRGIGPEIEIFSEPVKCADNIKTACLNTNSPSYITLNDELYMWGLYNTAFQNYGDEDGKGMTMNPPEKVADHILQAYGYYNNMYLNAQGQLITFGGNQSGKLGIGISSGSYFAANKHTVLQNVTKLFYGSSIYVITTTGEVYTWGSNITYSGGEGPGNGQPEHLYSPRAIRFN